MLINFTLLPKNSQNFFNFSTLSLFEFLVSQIIVNLFLNKSLKPAEGPLSSVPAIGWDDIQEILVKFKFSNVLFTSFFTDPVSVIIAPFLNVSFADNKTSL